MSDKLAQLKEREERLKNLNKKIDNQHQNFKTQQKQQPNQFDDQEEEKEYYEQEYDNDQDLQDEFQDEYQGQEQQEEDMLQKIIKKAEARDLDEQIPSQQQNPQSEMQDIEARFKNIQRPSKEKQNEIERLLLEIEEQQTAIKMQQLKQQAIKSEIDTQQQKYQVNSSIILDLTQKEENVKGESEKYSNQIASIIQKIEETKQNHQRIINQGNEFNKENRQIQKDIDGSKKQFKTKEQELAKLDIRINRLQEDIDKQKMDIQKQKLNTLDKSGDSKKLKEKLTSDNQRLESQIKELLNAFKKQLRLIDILKRQKTHLIGGQIFAYSEEEFIKTLDLANQI